MGTISVMAPRLVDCFIPDRINQERRTKIARTVVTAARAYEKSGKPIAQPDRFAAAIIGRRLRATAAELAQIDARDEADADKIDMGGAISQGAIDAAWILRAPLPEQARNAVYEVIGHKLGSDETDCRVCDTYRQAKSGAEVWQELIKMTRVSPRIIGDVAMVLAANGYLKDPRKRTIVREDDF